MLSGKMDQILIVEEIISGYDAQKTISTILQPHIHDLSLQEKSFWASLHHVTL